jgi:hypothetical protein
MFLLDAKREILLRPNSIRQMDAWVDWYLKWVTPPGCGFKPAPRRYKLPHHLITASNVGLVHAVSHLKFYQ